MGAHASSFDQQAAAVVLSRSNNNNFGHNNSSSTLGPTSREIVLNDTNISQRTSFQSEQRGSSCKQTTSFSESAAFLNRKNSVQANTIPHLAYPSATFSAPSPIETLDNILTDKPTLIVIGRQSSSSSKKASTPSSSSSSTTAAAVAFNFTNDFDFYRNDNRYSSGSPYSRRRTEDVERNAATASLPQEVNSPSNPLATTSSQREEQRPQQTHQHRAQFVRGVSTEIPNNINYEPNNENTTNHNSSSKSKSNKKRSKNRSTSRSSIWQRFASTSSSSLTTKSNSTVALNCRQQQIPGEGHATAAAALGSQKKPSFSSCVANDADESLLVNQPLRKRSLTESISLKKFSERRILRSRNKLTNKQQQQPSSEVPNNTSSTIDTDSGSINNNNNSSRPATSHGSFFGAKSHQQTSIIGSSARRAVTEGLSKLMIPFRNTNSSSSSIENNNANESKMMKTTAVKTPVATTTTNSNRPSSATSTSSAREVAAVVSSHPDVPEVFTTSADTVTAEKDQQSSSSAEVNNKIPVLKIAGVPTLASHPPPPPHSSSTSTLLLTKDVEQLSLSSGSGGGGGGHHHYAHHGGGHVHVGGGTRRNSRPRESPVHQARSNIIAENMQALLQTDATTGALLQEHLSESHRGAIVTSIMSPTSDDASGRGGGGGDYDYYYAAQAQASDAACQRDKFPSNLCKPTTATGAAAAVTMKKTAPQAGSSAALKPFMSTGSGGLAVRRKSRTDEIRAYIAAGNDNANTTANETTNILGAGDGATTKLQQHQRHSEDLVTTTTSRDDVEQFSELKIAAADKPLAIVQSSTTNSDSTTPFTGHTADPVAARVLPNKPSLAPASKIPAPSHKLMTSEPMVAEMLNNQVWKRLTEKSMLQKSSSSDMLKCVGAFLHSLPIPYKNLYHRRFAHLSHLFQPNEPVLWMRGVDRSLIAQGWQDMAFLSPANIVFVYMLLRTLDGHVAGNLRQLQAHVLTALYVSYSYMGHEISYPVRLFLAADVEHKERFWLRCMRLVDDAGDNMLRINNDPLLFSALFHELIAHIRYTQPQPPSLSPSLTLPQPSSGAVSTIQQQQQQLATSTADIAVAGQPNSTAPGDEAVQTENSLDTTSGGKDSTQPQKSSAVLNETIKSLNPTDISS